MEMNEVDRFSKSLETLMRLVTSCVTVLNQKGIKSIDASFLRMCEGLVSAADKKDLISGFINNTHIHWETIFQRDETFFIDNAGDLFTIPIDTSKLDIFRDIMKGKNEDDTPLISTEIKNQLWNILEVMIKISIKYIHNGRAPFSYKCDSVSPSKLIPAYGAEFFDNIDLRKYVPICKLKLPFPERLTTK